MNLPSRKIRLRAVGGSSPGALGIESAPPPQADFLHNIEDQRAEIGRVARRLEGIVATHLESARRMHESMTPAQIRAVLDALRVEAREAGRPPTFAGSEVGVYLQQTLYEELLEEPSNIFYSTRVSEEVMRYEPLPRDFWLACLDALQARLTK